MGLLLKVPIAFVNLHYGLHQVILVASFGCHVLHGRFLIQY